MAIGSEYQDEVVAEMPTLLTRCNLNDLRMDEVLETPLGRLKNGKEVGRSTLLLR